jgi:hypothetical protein
VLFFLPSRVASLRGRSIVYLPCLIHTHDEADPVTSKTTDAATLPLSSATRQDQAGFVVWGADGRFWDGQDWTEDVDKAQRFSGAPDPWADANAVVQRLRAAGTVCNVAALPVTFRPAGRPKRPRRR